MQLRDFRNIIETIYLIIAIQKYCTKSYFSFKNQSKNLNSVQFQVLLILNLNNEDGKFDKSIEDNLF